MKAKQRKEASGKSISQIQASSDGNTRKTKHKLRGGGWEKQPKQNQGESTQHFMQSACQISAYAHYARTPVLQQKQRTDDIHI